MADAFKLVSGGEDIKLWEPPNLRLIQTFKPHSQGISSLAWSPNNHFLASTAPGDQVVVTSFKGGTPNSVELMGCESDTCVAFNSSSRHLLTAGENKVLNLWDLKTRTIKKKIKNHKDSINCVTFNWNDTSIASGTTTGDVLLHSVSTTQTSAPLRLQKTQTIHALQYSKFKKALLGSVSDDGAMNIWDTNSKKVVASFPDQHQAPAMDICFSPMNDMLLASTGLDKKIIFYDVLGKKVIKEMSAESPLTSISFMQDGAAFAVGSTRGKIYVYDLRSGSTPLHSTVAHKSAVHCLSFQLPSKGSNSSSSTLAEKFTSRSAMDSSKPSVSSKLGTEPAQNGLKTNNEESAIFSPLREGHAPNNNLGKEPTQKEQYEPSEGGSKKTDSITVSGIFSPLSSSTSSHQLPSTQPTDTFFINSSNTHDLNGYSAASLTTNDMPRVTKQIPALKTSTAHQPKIARPNTSSASNDNLIKTPTNDTRKAESSDKLNTDEQLVLTNSRSQAVAFGSSLPPLSQMQVGKHCDISSKTQQSENLSSHVSLAGADMKTSREVVNHFIQPTATGTAENLSGFQQFQIQFIKNLIDDSLDEFRTNFHRDIVNLQVEMLRQFQIQQNEMKALMQQYSLNDALVEENERLKEEIKKLKATH